VLSGIVNRMAHRIQGSTYRSTAELIKAIRDEHVLTQDERRPTPCSWWPAGHQTTP